MSYSEKKIYVLYHGACMDGLMAAATFVHFAHKEGLHGVTYQDVFYNQPFPPQVEDGSVVFVLDFSYPKEVLLEQRRRLDRLVIIDHHKTAEDNLQGVPDTVFDQNHSGAVLSWKYLFPRTPVPRILLYVEDRDLWRWQLKDSKAINACLFSDFYGKTPGEVGDTWVSYSDVALETMVLEGEAILGFERMIIDQGVGLSFERLLCGKRCRVANVVACYSEIGQALLDKHPEIELAVLYQDLPNGTRKYSLRSRPGTDMTPLAKAFGGGGHPTACGFVLEVKDGNSPWDRQ